MRSSAGCCDGESAMAKASRRACSRSSRSRSGLAMWKPKAPDWRGPEKLPGAAELQIGFGDFETVGGAHHCFEAGAGFVGHAHGADEDAVGFLHAAADAPAQLMELGEAEALGVLDDHDGGVRDVDADFDDGGGDEDLHFVFAELLHD